jgi:hypothetical protein
VGVVEQLVDDVDVQDTHIGTSSVPFEARLHLNLNGLAPVW